MRFVLKQTGCGNERIGTLSEFLKSTAIINTPTSAILTQGGSVVHLTAEVFAKVFSDPQLLWVPLSNIYQMEVGVKAQGEGIAKFAGLHNHVACLTVHNINEKVPSGHIEADKIPLWTYHGKKMITADRYMDLMELFKADLILAVADSRTVFNQSYKRIRKSKDRTCNMLSTCVKRYKASSQLQGSSMIGVIVGAGYPEICAESINNILTHRDSITGVALSGINDGSKDSIDIPVEKLDEIFKRVDESLPKDLVRILEGSWNPAIVLTAIQYGWDVFDGSYPLQLTNAGLALTLNFDTSRYFEDPCIIDLNSEQYKEAFIPILAECECLACKKHTRAYIRHLLNTREMLASVLLNMRHSGSNELSHMILISISEHFNLWNRLYRVINPFGSPRDYHNLHHFDQMFVHARRHIVSKTYSVYKEHITKQYQLYSQSEINDKNNTKNIQNVEEIVQVKKKSRISENKNVVNGSC